MHDEIVHVTVVDQELAELFGQLLLSTELLCADEALNHHTVKQK